MTRKALILLATIVLCIFLLAWLLPKDVQTPAALVLAPNLPFTYSFRVDGVLEEAGSAERTTSPYWWLNSGGKMLINDGVGSTIEGRLGALDKWRLRYGASNPTDTDEGYHPQNLFRLLSRSQWENPRIEAEFYITADNLSASPNRDESNGLLFMSRYQDANTLYYTGVRVDGHAVIKKKYRGTYYTMAEKSIFPGTYDRKDNPNLLPHGTWVPLRSEVRNTEAGVRITLYMRDGTEGSWVELLTAIDDGSYGGTPAIDTPGPIGIRTDFMDVRFRSIRIEELE